MSLISNQLRKQVDLPTWEWLRFSPVVPTTGLSCSCVADNAQFNETSGRYIYYLLNATNFWRYDTIADSYQQLASPPVPPASASSLRFAGAQGYFNRAISATSTTLVTGLPSGKSAIGYKVRVVSGKGAGQERVITNVSDPVVADFGAATSASTTSITDSAKNWFSGYTGSTGNVNGWVGYVVRTFFGTGGNQVRRILYNTNQIITTGDGSFYQNDVMALNTFAPAPAAASGYQIESSVITVDTAWDIVPDDTSRIVVQSGGIWLLSGAAAAPFHTMQYYDVLSDTWVVKSALQGILPAVPSDVSLERLTENNTIWWQSQAASGTTTSLVDSMSSGWTTNQWAGYSLYIYSGTGRGQLSLIASNTNNTLTFATLSTAPDATSKFTILGYDGGAATSATSFSITDTTKTWTTNQWTNFAVRILSGTGAGQLRTIASNTSTALTLASPWNISPDNTSIFVIQGTSDTMYFSWGGSAALYSLHTGNLDMLMHGRMSDSGIACIACALLSDVNHNIYEAVPYAITSLAGTTTITATTAQPHNLKVGRYVSIRGVTTAAADQYNVTGRVQITSVPSITTFTYTPSAAGSGTYAYLTALSTSNLSDASKDFRDNLSGSTTSTLSFTRTTPSNINGWYASGTNIVPGTRVSSGGGTTTLTLSATMASAPTGVITFSPWGPVSAVTSTFSSGGGTGVATVTLTASTNVNINGWYVTGTNIALNTTVTSGAGTATIILSNACIGAVSGTLTFIPPHVAGKLITVALGAPNALGNVTSLSMLSTAAGIGGGTMSFITALSAAPVAAVSRYTVTNPQILGAAIDGQTINYLSSVATGGSTNTLTDASAFWATATGTGSAQGTTITLSAPAPGNVNGWYVTGTGVNTGTKILSGAGTTTITVDVPHSGAVSGTITCAAWNQSLVGRRIKIQSGANANQELIITAVAPTTGTFTFVGPTPTPGVSVYSILSKFVVGAGTYLGWASNSTVKANRGKYLWLARGGGLLGIDKYDLTTDKIVLNQTTPFTETLSIGSMYAYDQLDRIYFTKDLTQRIYYVDLNIGMVHGAGVYPYIGPTTGIGNKMEIYTTADGLKYMWINRQQNQEHFRQLVFF